MKHPTRSILSLMAALMFITTIIPYYISESDRNLENNMDHHRETVKIDLSFDTSSILEITFNGRSYVTAEDHSIPFDEGAAALPFRTEKVLLHPDSFDLKLQVNDVHGTEVEFMFPVAGGARSVPYSIPEEVLPGEPVFYPEEHLTIEDEGWVRGLRLLDIRFNPIIKDQNGGYLTAENIEATLTFSVPLDRGDDLKAPFTRDTSVFRSSIENEILNPGDLGRFPARKMHLPIGNLPSDDVQYVVITNTSKVGDAFDPFIEWKNMKGIPTRIVETSYIDDNYNGTDMAERIRNFIKDSVDRWDTEFVLLGGDIAVVSYRGAYAKTYSSVQTSNACDLYFSDLDGTWNADGDSYWGETTDNVDLRPDVYVGRAPVENRAQAQNFVSKALSYEKEPSTGYLMNYTLAGEYLDSVTNSSRGMDMVKNNLLPGTSTSRSLYDSAKGSFGNLNRYTFMDSVDDGSAMILHAGHCNWNIMSVGTAGSGSLYNSHISGYDGEPRFGILNTVGCIANKFNQNDCIVEKHVIEPDGGTVAAIGNSHYGWYAYGYPGMGPSEQFLYRMVYELFKNDNVKMAQHFAEAKDYYVSSSGSYNSARWLQIVLNLLGDPETDIRTRDPMNLSVTMPETIGLHYNGFPVRVTTENGSAVEGALVCLQKSDYYSYKYTNRSGYALFNFTSESLDLLNITVTKMDHFPFITNLSIDVIAPWIEINLTGPGTTGDDYVFSCNITDEAGIENARIIFNGTLEDLELSGNGTSWKNNTTLPWNSTETIRFKIMAMDRSGNFNETGWSNLTVVDNDLPGLVEDRTSFTGTTGDSFRFEVEVEDNIGVDLVEVEYESSPGNMETKAMEISDGSIWHHIFQTPLDSIGKRTYTYRIMDYERNTLTTEERHFTIIDNDRPEIIEDLSDSMGTTGDPFHFRVNVSDNIEVSGVFVEYWLEGWSLHNNDTMEENNGTYELAMRADDSDLTPYNYILHVTDTSGNWEQIQGEPVGFSDNDEPQFVADQTVSEVPCGEDIPVSVKVMDNIGISKVRLFWREGEGPLNDVILTHGSGMIWGTKIRTSIHSTRNITYFYRAFDNSGNMNDSINSTVKVLDNIAPTVEEIWAPSSVNAGDDLSVSVDVNDNIGIKSVCLCWWFGGSKPVNVTLDQNDGSYHGSIRIPIDAYGTLYLSVKVRDTNDNVVTSDRKNVAIIEFIPEPEEETGPDPNRVPGPGEDLDIDGMDDLWEYSNGLDLTIDDSSLDADNDGYTNYQEFMNSTDPRDENDHPVVTEEDDDGPLPLIIAAVLVGLLVMITLTLLLVVLLRKGKDGSHHGQKGPHHHQGLSPHSHTHGKTQHHNWHASTHDRPSTKEDHPHSHPLSGDEILHPHHEH